MTTSATIRMLRRLIEHGTVRASQIPVSCRSELERLVATGAVRSEAAGAGMRYRLIDAAAVTGLIRRYAPMSADDPALVGLPARAQAVRSRRDSKLAAPDAPVVLLLRAVEPVMFVSDEGRQYDIQVQTRLAGVAALAVRPGDRWRTGAPLLLVENSETFFAAERLAGVDRQSCFIYYAGQLSRRLLEWLAEDRSPGLVLAPDYDPVGLRNYLALKRSGAAGTRLLVPDNLDELLPRFGKVSLLKDNLGLVPELLRSEDTDVLKVLALLQLHGCGLEQEVLVGKA